MTLVIALFTLVGRNYGQTDGRSDFDLNISGVSVKEVEREIKMQYRFVSNSLSYL